MADSTQITPRRSEGRALGIMARLKSRFGIVLGSGKSPKAGGALRPLRGLAVLLGAILGFMAVLTLLTAVIWLIV